MLLLALFGGTIILDGEQNGVRVAYDRAATRRSSDGQQGHNRAQAGTHASAVTLELVTADSEATEEFSAASGTSGVVRSGTRRLPTVEGYQILGELGRGGMGVVYKARQQSLNRLVALKMVLSGAHASAAQLARFHTEALSVARLQHPNIVQIYDVGEHAGLPYFSLEYVDGIPLDKKIDRKPQQPRYAAELVQSLARTMHVAHQNNIIHRDLKPANVLLTKEGVPKITDFGLAKAVEDDSSQTRSGTILGSPSYMSPEQARGAVKDVGPLADLYTLGSVLYELLTGRPPFQGATVMETLDQVLSREPLPPSQLQPTVPPDLETICLKCLQKEPHKRYRDCEALADDLRRFLAGEPILARPVSQTERLWRWCKRNPRVAWLSAAVLLLLLTVAITSTISAVRIAHEKKLAIEARDLATRKANEAEQAKMLADQRAVAEAAARELADENAKVASDQAQFALTTIQTLVDRAQKRLDDAPGNRELKIDLLKAAMDGLQEVSAMAKGSSTIEPTMAAAHMKMGLICKQLGQTEAAMEQFDRCRAITEARAKEKPNIDSRKSNLAAVLTVMGDMSQELRRDMEASLAYYQQALKLREEMHLTPNKGEGELEVVKVKLGLAEGYTRVATAIYRMGDPAEALKYFRQALQLRQELVDANPMNASMQQDLARTCMALGETSFRLNELDEARRWYAQCFEVRQRLFAANPKDFRSKHELARTCGMLGDIEFRTSNPAGAEPMYQRSLSLTEELADLDKASVDYQRDLGICHYRLGALFARAGESEAARQHFQECRRIREPLAPQNVRRQMELMLVVARLGEHFQAAALAEEVARQGNVDPEMLIELGRTYAQSAAATEDAALRQVYESKAVAAVSQAIEQGYKDLVFLQTEADFDPLRQHKPFATLLGY